MAASYARTLGHLSRDAFEAEVVIALQRTFPGFQRVPAKPKGDGGLDGLSHQSTYGYCCYGLDLQESPGTSIDRLRAKTGEKFKKDLLRILELARVRNGTPKHKKNTKLPEVLGGRKLKLIRLISNCFEDNRIIGDMIASFDQFVAASQCNHIEAGCELTVWGPLDLATHVVLDQQALTRLEFPGLMDFWNEARSVPSPPVQEGEDVFGDKFDDLAGRLPATKRAQAEEFRKDIQEAWRKTVALRERLATSTPTLHRELEAARHRAALDARQDTFAVGLSPIDMIARSRERLVKRLDEMQIGALPVEVRDVLATGETGRLIGECSMDWREPADGN